MQPFHQTARACIRRRGWPVRLWTPSGTPAAEPFNSEDREDSERLSHNGVLSVGFSPDGRIIVAAGADRPLNSGASRHAMRSHHSGRWRLKMCRILPRRKKDCNMRRERRLWASDGSRHTIIHDLQSRSQLQLSHRRFCRGLRTDDGAIRIWSLREQRSQRVKRT